MEQKVALVTGASRGIGRAIALKLAAQDMYVIVNYASSAEKAQAVLGEIRAAGGDGCCMGWDVSDFTATENAMKEIIRTCGHLDVVVNNAGITRDGLLMSMKEADYDRVLDVNLKGAFFVIRFAARQMLKQRSGRIINISSVSGRLGNAGQANYCAAKAGLLGLTKSAARELGSRGITVNVIAPGFIETEMTEGLSEELRAKMQERIPLGHMGTAENVADAAAFLASDQASYITGQVLSVDGGMYM